MRLQIIKSLLGLIKLRFIINFNILYMFQTKITSQGTISIPAVIRRKYNIKAGELVTIEDTGTGKITISKSTDFATLRKMNSPYLSNNPTSYKNGDGLEAYVIEKYGQK